MGSSFTSFPDIIADEESSEGDVLMSVLNIQIQELKNFLAASFQIFFTSIGEHLAP